MNWKVVIIEDEDLLRNGLLQTIPWEKLGFSVVGDADNGKRGLELIKEQHPHVVLSDIRMAQMDGLTMAENVHQWDPDIRIVFISGYDEFEYAMRALKVGAAAYILKPIQLDQVNATLERLGEELAREQLQRQEYHKLKEMEKYTIDQIRQELYRSVIYGIETDREEKTWLEETELEEKDFFFDVLIVERRDFAALSMNADYIEIMEMDHTFGSVLKAVLGEELEYTMVRGSACERILVFSGPERQGVQKKEQECRKFLEEEEYQIGTGKVQRHVEGLHYSYLRARRDLEEQYQREWNQIIETESRISESVTFMNYDKEPLIQAVKSGSIQRIREEFAKVEERLGNHKQISHMHLILIVTSIFEELVRLPQEIGQTVEEAVGKPMEDYHRIISKGKRQEIMEGLEDYCIALGKCFEETRESKLQISLKRAIAYMNQEYAKESLMMGDVAKHAYISSSYLSLLLKKETGKTFIEYLTDIRMEKAKKLLAETGMKNYEVAKACGFANATYFSTVFKSVYGMSPSAFRKEESENS